MDRVVWRTGDNVIGEATSSYPSSHVSDGDRAKLVGLVIGDDRCPCVAEARRRRAYRGHLVRVGLRYRSEPPGRVGPPRGAHAVDWDGLGRSQRVDILDAASLAVLDTRTMSNFQGGQSLTWSLTGRVKIRVTLTSGANAVVSGLFFNASSGPSPASAVFQSLDTTTQRSHGSAGSVPADTTSSEMR